MNAISNFFSQNEKSLFLDISLGFNSGLSIGLDTRYIFDPSSSRYDYGVSFGKWASTLWTGLKIANKANKLAFGSLDKIIAVFSAYILAYTVSSMNQKKETRYNSQILMGTAFTRLTPIIFTITRAALTVFELTINPRKAALSLATTTSIIGLSALSNKINDKQDDGNSPAVNLAEDAFSLLKICSLPARLCVLGLGDNTLRAITLVDLIADTFFKN
jgi:hypothetical protein